MLCIASGMCISKGTHSSGKHTTAHKSKKVKKAESERQPVSDRCSAAASPASRSSPSLAGCTSCLGPTACLQSVGWRPLCLLSHHRQSSAEGLQDAISPGALPSPGCSLPPAQHRAPCWQPFDFPLRGVGRRSHVKDRFSSLSPASASVAFTYSHEFGASPPFPSSFFFFFLNKRSLPCQTSFSPWTLPLPAVTQAQKYYSQGESLPSRITMPAALLATSSTSDGEGVRVEAGIPMGLQAGLVPKRCALKLCRWPRAAALRDRGTGRRSWARSLCPTQLAQPAVR